MAVRVSVLSIRTTNTGAVKVELMIDRDTWDYFVELADQEFVSKYKPDAGPALDRALEDAFSNYFDAVESQGD